MLEISLKKSGPVVILDLSGSIDLDSSNFVEKIAWCLEQGYTDLLCNFENVNLLDYAGLSVLAIAYKNVLNHKGKMIFVNVASHIRKIFSMAGLDVIFEVFEDEDLALRSFEEEKIISEIQKQNLRRRFKRLPVDFDIEFKLPSETLYQQGKVLNISAVGVLVFTEKIYNLGDIVNIKLNLLPKPGIIELKARVVWLVQKEIQPQIYPGMGLEFYNTNTSIQKDIVEFVERNLPLGSISESQ